MSGSVPVAMLATYEQMANMTGGAVDANTLRRWKSRGHIKPVRDDLLVFDWAEVRPEITRRLGKPSGSWAGKIPARDG